MKLVLNEDLDLELLALKFARQGRVQVTDFLTPHSAQSVHEVLLRQTPWNYVFSRDHKRYVFNQRQFAQLSAQQVNQIQDDVAAAAREGFAFFFRSFSMSAEEQAGRRTDHPLFGVLDFMNTTGFLDVIRHITGRADIMIADATASCYGPSSFLTEHDDAKEDEERIAAYVLNMTPSWKPSWGGYLQFFDQDGNMTHGLMPSYNALNIFLVPARHAVGQVATFAGSFRYSIQGWFKSAVDSKLA